MTQTDLRAEDLIRRRLREATPQAGVLGEEGETTAPGARLQWVIDPLDGTVNFLYGVPIFAVSIAAATGATLAEEAAPLIRNEADYLLSHLAAVPPINEMSPDHHVLLGPSPGIPNLYLANGSSGHGVMHAPALGQPGRREDEDLLGRLERGRAAR